MAARYSVKLSRHEMERRRLAAGREFLRAGRKRGMQAQVAAKYGVSTATANRWHKAVQKKGLKGLRPTKAKGNPARLTASQRKKLRSMLLQGALVHGFDTDVWTGKRVARLIRDSFGVEYSAKYVPQLLREQLGFSPQKPDRRPRELDPKKVQKWLDEVWEPVKKGRSRANIPCGFSTNPGPP